MDNQTIRAYLLGQLSDEERDALEERMFTEANVFPLIEAEEDDLHDAYVANQLAPAHRKAWDRYLAAHPDSQRRLRLAQALHDRRRSPVRQYWRWFGAVAAMLVLGLFLWNLRPKEPQQIAAAIRLAPGTLRDSAQPQTVRLTGTTVRLDFQNTTGASFQLRAASDLRTTLWIGSVTNGIAEVPTAKLNSRSDYIVFLLDAQGEEVADYAFRAE